MDELYISSSQESYVLLTAQGSVFQVLSVGSPVSLKRLRREHDIGLDQFADFLLQEK
ncbi:MAG: hypothetical protein IMW89_08515 [Ktedonobacteraceae bacterium]|nr:hypothetical protein [Ktedonobacteraceae bacterium]